MSIMKVSHNLAIGLRTYSSWDYKIALCLAALTASISVLRVFFNLGYNYGVFKSLEGNHTTCCINLLESYLIPITAGFIVTAVGLWLRRATGFLISLLALFWVGVVYILWHLSTLSAMREYEAQKFSQMLGQEQHLLALLDATWWDLVVLAITLVLFTWQIKTLFMVNRKVH